MSTKVSKRQFLSILLVVGLGIFIEARHVRGQFTLAEDFTANEAVETLSVQLSVGATGDPLAEPVALDLGLNFPLWLYPLGQADGELPMFGAVPGHTDCDGTVPEGTQAEFVFGGDAELGQDVLQAGSQLMAGVQLSDVSRIGFMSRGDNAWELAAYRIEINGRLFAANDRANAAVAEIQQAAAARLAELGVEISPLETEVENIRILAEAELASDEDLARLEEIEALLGPWVGEQNRLHRQLQGSYPWFIEPEFVSPWRTDQQVERARVTLVTAAHAGAETGNYVYYRCGGHKFLLSSPMNPLSPENGLTVVPLDLLSGPLTAADLRGHAWGMLAHPEPYGDAPDRWHPERLIVEMDGSVIYDSDASEIDRLSLEAIRLIPPAHSDASGGLVVNTPVARETFIWEAGQGYGLDLVNGGAAALPGLDDDTFPEAEPGLDFDEDSYAGAEYYDGFDPGFDPFPGEVFYEETWGWGTDYFTDDYVDDFPWTPPPSWMDLLSILQLLDQIHDVVLDGAEADAAGDPVQIEDVRVQQLPMGDFHITWDVHEDEADVLGYLVELHVLRPHSSSPLSAGVWSTVVGPGIYQADAVGVLPDLEAEAGSDRVLAYVVASVAPQMADETNPGQLSPAIPLVPGVRLSPDGDFWFEDILGVSGTAPYSIGEPTTPRAVWFPGPADSHIGFVFDTAGIGQNIVLRPEAGDQSLAQVVVPDTMLDGEYQLVCHLAFLGTSDGAANAATAELEIDLLGDGLPPYGPEIQNGTIVQQLIPLTLDINTADSGPGAWPARIRVLIRGGDVDFDHPPVLIGLRLVQP